MEILIVIWGLWLGNMAIHGVQQHRIEKMEKAAIQDVQKK